MPVHPNSLANLTPWQPGEQPKPGPRYIEKMLERGNKMAPQAIAVIGRVMKDDEVHGELVPLHLRLRAAEYIVDRHWPKAPAANGTQINLGGDGSLTIQIVRPGEAQTVTLNLNGHDSGDG